MHMLDQSSNENRYHDPVQISANIMLIEEKIESKDEKEKPNVASLSDLNDT